MFKKLKYIILPLLLVFLNSGIGKLDVTVYAETQVKPFVIMDSDSGVSSAVANVNSQIQKELGGVDKVTFGWKFLSYNSQLKRVELDKDVYASQSLSTRRKIMSIALTQLSEENATGIGKRDRARLYNFIESQDQDVARVLQAINTDVKADIGWAMSVLDVIKKPFNSLLGILAMLVTAFVGLQIAIDTFVMVTSPVMYWLVQKYGTKRPPFVSPEAWFSYKESMDYNGYKDYLMSYLAKSFPKMIMTGICLSCIIVGNIASIAIFFANIFAR